MWGLNLACYSEEQFYTDLVLQHSRLGLSIGALVVLQFFQPLQDWNAGITALGRKQKWQAALATAEGMERRCLAIQMGFCTDLGFAKLPCLHLLLLHFLDSKHSSARCQIPWDEFTFCALIAACSSASLPGAWGNGECSEFFNGWGPARRAQLAVTVHDRKGYAVTGVDASTASGAQCLHHGCSCRSLQGSQRMSKS